MDIAYAMQLLDAERRHQLELSKQAQERGEKRRPHADMADAMALAILIMNAEKDKK